MVRGDLPLHHTADSETLITRVLCQSNNLSLGASNQIKVKQAWISPHTATKVLGTVPRAGVQALLAAPRRAGEKVTWQSTFSKAEAEAQGIHRSWGKPRLHHLENP